MSERPGGVSRARLRVRSERSSAFLAVASSQLPGVLRMFLVQPNCLLMQLTATQHDRDLFPGGRSRDRLEAAA